MAESTTSLDYNALVKATAERCGYGYTAYASLTSNQQTEVDLYVQEGYREWLQAFDWSFLRPVTTSVLFATTTTGTVSGTPSHSAGLTTITATASKFYPTMEANTFTFDTSGTEYTIATYTSATVIVVYGDASGETADDTFTITGTGKYQLPDDFGGFIGDVYFSAGAGRWLPIEITGIAEVLDMHQRTTGQGRPTLGALQIEPVSDQSTNAIGQRWSLLVWRYPDANYTIRYQYQVLPHNLATAPSSSTSTQYPYGGARHAETILYACYAAAERSKYKVIDGPDGAHYQRLLARSIQIDKKFTRAGTLGYLVSTQDGIRDNRSRLPEPRNITVGGVSYP